MGRGWSFRKAKEQVVVVVLGSGATLVLALLFLTLNGGQQCCLSPRGGDYQYYIHSYVCLITLHSGLGVVCNILVVVGVVCSGFKCVTTTHSL